MSEETDASKKDSQGHSRPKDLNKHESTVLQQHQNITPEDLRDIDDAFNQFRVLDSKVSGDDGIIKVKELGLAMRKVRFTPGPVELQEIQKEVDVRTEKKLAELREQARKKNDPTAPVPSINAGVDR